METHGNEVYRKMVSDFRDLYSRRDIPKEDIKVIVSSFKGILQPNLSSSNIELLQIEGFKYNSGQSEKLSFEISENLKSLEKELKNIEDEEKSNTEEKYELLKSMSIFLSKLSEIAQKSQNTESSILSEEKDVQVKNIETTKNILNLLFEEKTNLNSLDRINSFEQLEIPKNVSEMIKDRLSHIEEKNQKLEEKLKISEKKLLLVELIEDFLFLNKKGEFEEFANEIVSKVTKNLIHIDYSSKRQNISEQIEKLTKKLQEINNKDNRFIVTDYTNASFVKSMQDRINLFERYHKKGLAMVASAKLEHEISSEETSFKVIPFSPEDLTKKGPLGHKGIPIIESISETNISSPFTTTGHNYVFWLRIGDELMKVVGWDPDNFLVNVERGFDKTEKINHYPGEIITTPIYETGEKESKAHAFPVSGNERIHYGLDVSESNKQGFLYKAERIVKAVEHGYDGVSIDLLSTRQPPYNYVDCFGRKARPWNHNTNTFQTVEERQNGFLEMIRLTYEFVKEKTSKDVYINGNEANWYMTNKNKKLKTPLSASIMENAFPILNRYWDKSYKKFIKMGEKDQNIRVVMGPGKWVMTPGKFVPMFNFCFCQYLLFVGEKTDNFIFGCCFNQHKNKNSKKSELHIPKLAYLKTGLPISDIINKENIYYRHFENVTIFIYPYTKGKEQKIILEKKLYEHGKEVKEIILKPYSSKVLHNRVI